MSGPDLRLACAVTAVLGETARTIILPRYNRLAAGDIRTKTSAVDLVTVADEEGEKALAAALTALIPASKVLGEEGVSADPPSLETLLGHDPLWIVDPVDGTANFVGGRAEFAVIVALVHGAQTLMGWIHDPLSGRTLWAQRGEGAWLRDGTDTRMRIAPSQAPLKDLTAAFYSREFADLKGRFARVMRQGSAAHDYWALADDRLQVLGYRRLKPWDHAAGVLIHTEAGGYNRMLSGAAYDPRAPEQVGLLCAPDAKTWHLVKDLVDGATA